MSSTGRTPLARFLIWWLVRSLLGAVALAILTYLGDWAVFMARGKPTGQVTVNRYLATPLKGNNTEVDFEGEQPVSCAGSIFPQSGMQACWYLRRHLTQFDRP